ncbi:MFS transporter [Thermoplasma sp.]|uniref:MFS transporter n=1 Tax=Thermoplasma sp. TaxID=1973142 RepID=UPI001270D16F|nr:MFS transporter [Thermoplasma sp.]KAA8923408.1 MAG: MFS transporter [Thermoplasma sp.]
MRRHSDNSNFGAVMRDRNASLIGIIEGMRTFSAFLPIPVFSLYAFRYTNSGILAGIALGIYGIAMIFSQIFMGTLSDTIGRKNVSIISSILFSIGNLISWHPMDIQILIFSRFLAGLGAISSPLMALLNERASPERRTAYMAFVGTFSGIGIVIGVIAGPELSNSLGINAIFLISTVLGLVSILPIWLLCEGDPVINRHLRMRGDLPFTFSSFVSSFLLFAIFFFLPIYWSSGTRVISYGSFIILSLIPAGLIGIFISIRAGMRVRIATVTLILFAISAVSMFYFSGFLYSVMIGFFVFAIAYTIFEISFIPLLIRDQSGDYGSIIGFFNGGRYAGEFAGSLAMGTLFVNSRIFHGMHALLLVIMLMIAFSILLLNVRYSKYGNVFNIHN